MIIIYNAAAVIDGTDDLNAYQTKDFYGMESTAAAVVKSRYFGAVSHLDAGDVIALTVVDTGSHDEDRAKRVLAMDAMVSKQNTVNKQGFVVAFSEIENVKPGGIASIAVTIDS